MATRTILELIDDLDGTAADRTVVFELDGQVYEIDLNTKNAVAFEKLMHPYVSAARRIRPKRARRTQ